MRVWLFERLTATVAMTALVADRIYEASKLKTVPAVKPFIVYRFLDTTPEVADAKSHIVQVWCHDNRGSYVRIDAMLAALRTSLKAADNSGAFMQAIWQGDGPDLVDDVFDTNTRYGTYRIVST